MAKIEKKVEDLLETKITEIGYELYDVEYIKEGKDYFLRIYIDSKNGITLEDCEKVSDSISDILDEADLIKEQYFLEVSSPGIERVLKKDKHLKDNLGNQVQVKLFNSLKGKKVINGNLTNYSKDTVEVEVNEEKILIDRKNITQIKTIFDW